MRYFLFKDVEFLEVCVAVAGVPTQALPVQSVSAATIKCIA